MRDAVPHAHDCVVFTRRTPPEAYRDSGEGCQLNLEAPSGLQVMEVAFGRCQEGDTCRGIWCCTLRTAAGALVLVSVETLAAAERCVCHPR